MKLLKGCLEFLGLLFLLFCMAVITGHCERTSGVTPQPPAVSEYVNPNTYFFGAIAAGAVLQDGKDEKAKYATALVLAPYRTPLVYTEEILLCGNLTEQLRNMGGPIVLSYVTQSHQAFKGVGCHELNGVYRVDAEDVQ